MSVEPSATVLNRKRVVPPATSDGAGVARGSWMPAFGWQVAGIPRGAAGSRRADGSARGHSQQIGFMDGRVPCPGFAPTEGREAPR